MVNHKFNKEYLETERGEKIIDLMSAIHKSMKCEGKLICVFSKDGGNIEPEFIWIDNFTLNEVIETGKFLGDYCIVEDIDSLKTEDEGDG